MANGLNGKEDNYYYGSMICTMPQERPKYTIMVAICKQSTPDNSLYFGIDLAGPVAADMLEYIYANDHSLHAPIETPTQRYSPVSIKAGQTGYVKRVSNILGQQTTDNSDNSRWSSASVDAEGNVAISGITIDEGTVPNVVGMGLTDALYLLECSGIKVTHSGVGRVKRQSIPAGRTIRDNMTIQLTLER
jgi:cell division protein FtsI (penicillin-binding protein 3)